MRDMFRPSSGDITNTQNAKIDKTEEYTRQKLIKLRKRPPRYNYGGFFLSFINFCLL